MCIALKYFIYMLDGLLQKHKKYPMQFLLLLPVVGQIRKMAAIQKSVIHSTLTSSMKEELLTIAGKLSLIGDRGDRENYYQIAMETVSFDTKKLLDLLNAKEKQHIKLVNHVLSQITNFPSGAKHDECKDLLYFFITGLKKDCELEGEAVEMLFKDEVQRHYRLESHHPEHESVAGSECSENDVIQMAVDRLCRNAQNNGGGIDLAQMAERTPNFTLGDTERKKELFKGHVDSYKSLVESGYQQLFSA